MTLTFRVDEAGERLDTFLAQRCPDLSRSRIQALTAEGCVTVDGAPAKPAARLREGQTVSLVVPPPVPSSLVPQAMDLHVVHEDSDLLVIDKPAGLVTHPAPGHPTIPSPTPCWPTAPTLRASEARSGPALCTAWTRIRRG